MIDLSSYISSESEDILKGFCGNQSTGSTHPNDLTRWNRFIINVVEQEENYHLTFWGVG